MLLPIETLRPLVFRWRGGGGGVDPPLNLCTVHMFFNLQQTHEDQINLMGTPTSCSLYGKRFTFTQYCYIWGPGSSIPTQG